METQQAKRRILTAAEVSKVVEERQEMVPPQGTIMYGENGEFGVKWMTHRIVRTFDEDRGSEALYCEGTQIAYEPGSFKVHVTGRDLSGDDINTIGKLSTDLSDSSYIMEFLPETVKSTEEVIANLEIIKDKTREDELYTKLISDLGVSLRTMKEGSQTQDDVFMQTCQVLDSLGVSLVEYRLPRRPDARIPIKLAILQAKELRAEQTKEAAQKEDDSGEILSPVEIAVLETLKIPERQKILGRNEGIAALLKDLGIRNMTTAATGGYETSCESIELNELEDLVRKCRYFYSDRSISLSYIKKEPKRIKLDKIGNSPMPGAYQIDLGEVRHPQVKMDDGSTYTFTAVRFANDAFMVSTTIESATGEIKKARYIVSQLREILADKLSLKK